jgi:hypothetical protein
MSQRHPQTISEATLLVGEPVGWGARLFGMFFLLPGLAAIWAYFNVEIHGEPLAALIVGGVFSLVGAAFVGAFKRVKIDRQQGFAETAAGAFIAFKRTRIPLAGITHVSLSKQQRTRRSKNRTYTYFVYPVKLVGNEELECSDSQQYEYARGEAEAIARHLRLPVEDSSNGDVQRREHDELDASLAQRRRKAGESTALPVLPPDTGLHVREENGVTRINLPPAANKWPRIVISMVMVVPIYFLVSHFMHLDEPNTPAWFRYWVLGIVFVPLGWQVLQVIVQMRMQRQLLLTHQEMRYVRRFLFGRTQHMSKQALEELDLQPGRVIATSDAGQLIIPMSVRKPSDSRFVYEMILYRLGR